MNTSSVNKIISRISGEFLHYIASNINRKYFNGAILISSVLLVKKVFKQNEIFKQQIQFLNEYKKEYLLIASFGLRTITCNNLCWRSSSFKLY